MVHRRQPLPIQTDGSIDIDKWIARLHIPETAISLIQNACQLARFTGEDQTTRLGSNCFLQGLELAEMLDELQLDAESMAAAIVYSTLNNTDLTIEDVKEELGESVANLLNGVSQLGIIHLSREKQEKQSAQQIDRIRQMLLAMVRDVRVVVIKLADRLSLMRILKNFKPDFRKHIAQETKEIYAPLANRLGLHQIKWELEDLAFFNLEPGTYKNIAKQLDERRVDREKRVKNIVKTLQKELEKINVKANVYGRAKHIFSIKRKMTRKNVDLSQIYDAIAVRILVPEIKDCYAALSIAHELWQPIPEEFDDYITTPKPNGYRSIHTAVIDKDGKTFEIQIRTHQMHEESELGVAAHWVYKEGKHQKSSYEEKIAWLRQLLDWQKEMIHKQELPEQVDKSIFEDRVYVFTPADDIIDLPIGATPLDFAYHIHTQVGHSCRGAKVNGKIVPLTYPLKMGEKIEILTVKNGEPSRDWLSPKTGYLKTSNARAKVLQWFRKQDYEKHVRDGKAILEKELQRLHISDVNFAAIAAKLNFKATDLMFAGLIRGNVRLSHIAHLIQAEHHIERTYTEEEPIVVAQPSGKPSKQDTVSVEGTAQLMSKIAKCCKPVPGDSVIGYITQTQGISIHRQDCNNITYAREHNPERLIDVQWQQQQQRVYPVDIEVLANEQASLIKDLTTALANEKIRLINLNANFDRQEHSLRIVLTVETTSIDSLNKIIDRIQQIPQVRQVKRLQQ